MESKNGVIQKNTEENLEQKNQQQKENAVARTQFQIVFRQFKKHKLAMVGVIILVIFYVVGVFFPGFFSPNTRTSFIGSSYLPPQRIHFFDEDGNFHLRPFVYNWTQEMDRATFSFTTTYDKSERHHIYFFSRTGEEYSVLGLFKSDLKLFSVEEPGLLIPFGTEELGRCLFTRSIYAARISLTIGFMGVFISFILGIIIGGFSGLIGGWIDEIIQRFVELLMTIPRIPLWMALAAAVPRQWTAVQVYFAITILLSLIGWTHLARVVRGEFLSLREEDFVMAAKSYNASQWKILKTHLVPNTLTYIVVQITLSIPAMIIAETSLSFLGIGLRAPVVSWGVLLMRAQNFQTVSMHPWLMLPGLFVVISVLAFNFVGDGLRDAADPYD